MKQDTQSALVLAASSVASMLLAAGGDTEYITVGVAIVVLLVVVSLRSSWLGLLSLFPMLFAINPAPVAIGPAEASFALLAATSLFASLFEEAKEDGWGKLVRRYQWVVAISLVFTLSNLLMAKQNGVPFSDWVRGAVPFFFLLFALPLARTLVVRPERLAWMGWGVVAYLLMLMSHVVGYYIVHALYEPYWVIEKVGGIELITATSLTQNPEAIGPYFDRVTKFLPRATTVLMAAGLVMAIVVAVRADDWRLRLTAGLVSALCLLAMLVTYTRSMLLTAAIALLVFIAVLAWSDRKRLTRALAILMLLGVWGGVVIVAFDMSAMWIYRISVAHTLDQEVAGSIASRMQEIQMAWGRFQYHPLLGNGLGIKNPVVYLGESGPIEKQVAYIHNWFFYILMVGGVVGLALYAWLLFLPVLSGWRYAVSEPLTRYTCRFGILTFSGYGMTFAVFRQIDFNFLLAAALAMAIATRKGAGA